MGNRSITVGPTGWTLNSNEVMTPKLPPPPRTAQNRSPFSLSLAVRKTPSAVTMSTETRLSRLRPYLPRSQPMPPARVRPPTPVAETTPPGVAKPWTCASRSKSPQVAPPWTRARRVLGSTCTAFIVDRSIRMPPSHEPLPAELWPPPRTAVSIPFSRAKFTASMTSAVPLHRAMSAGFLSNMPFQISRAPS